MPVWDANSDLTAVYRATGIVPAQPTTVTAFLSAQHELRPVEELRLERDRGEAWHWRSRAQRLLLLDAERARGTPAVRWQGHKGQGESG